MAGSKQLTVASVVPAGCAGVRDVEKEGKEVTL